MWHDLDLILLGMFIAFSVVLIVGGENDNTRRNSR